MAQNNNILQELSELNSSLVNIAAENVYTVPAGYFDSLLTEVLKRLRTMEATTVQQELNFLSPLLTNVSKQMPFEVPAGYFEQLPEIVISVVKNGEKQTVTEELETLSPMLSSLKKQMPAGPYNVPQGYFETLEKPNRETKVVSLVRRSWFRYAAAAVVIGIVTFTGISIVRDNRDPEAKSLTRFEKKLNREIKKMSDKELNDFIQYTDAGLNGEEKVSNNPNQEVKDLLKDVPDSELKQFLEETSDTETGSIMMN